MTDFDAYIGSEYVRWRGKPKRSCFVLECIFNPLLFIALIWGGFDLMFFFIFKNVASLSMPKPLQGFIWVFFLIHMMPVWLYLGGVLFSFLRQRNIEYAITDRGIYFSSGVFSKNIEFKPFAEISDVSMHRGMIDRMTGCGDVAMRYGASGKYTTGGSPSGVGYTIQDIPDYQEVFQLVRRMQTDIYADTMYPNALRPENNPGYNTQYQPTDRRY